jgi:hypothetical protein
LEFVLDDFEIYQYHGFMAILGPFASESNYHDTELVKVDGRITHALINN